MTAVRIVVWATVLAAYPIGVFSSAHVAWAEDEKSEAPVQLIDDQAPTVPTTPPEPIERNTPPHKSVQQASKTVVVRSGIHQRDVRLTFAWPTKVSYTAKLVGNSVQLVFDEPVKLNLDNVRSMPRGFGQAIATKFLTLGGGSTSFSMAVPANSSLSHYWLGSKIVVDIKTAPTKTEDVKISSEKMGHEKAAAIPQVAVKPAASPPSPASDAAVAKNQLPNSADLPPPLKPNLVEATPPPTPVPATGVLVTKQLNPSSLKLDFSFAENVGLAMYARAGTHYLVFSQPAAMTLPVFSDAESARYLRHAAVQKLADGSLVSLNLTDGMMPSIMRDGYRWVITVRKQEVEPDKTVEVVLASADRGEAKASLSLEGATKLITLTDPVVGDVLKVLPTFQANIGIKPAQRYPEFNLLRSQQGVVIQPLADGIKITQANNALTINSSAGLYLGKNGTEGASDSNKSHWLLEFGNPDLLPDDEGYSKKRHALENAVVAEDADKNAARINLAKFYLNQAMTSEAMSVLQLLQEDDPEFFGRKEVSAMAVVALLMQQRLEGAELLLQGPTLIEEPEMRLWRGLLRAKQALWAEAAASFSQAPSMPNDYPAPYRMAIGKAMVRAAMATEQFGQADSRLDELSKDTDLSDRQQAELTLLRADLLKITQGSPKALPLWEKIQKDDDADPPTKIMAELNLTLADTEKGKLPLAEAIEALESFRFAWRGDEVEWAVANKLGDLYQTNHQYREAFDLWASLLRAYPQEKALDKIREKLNDMFATLFGNAKDPAAITDNADTKLQPLTAAALLGDYINYLGVDKVPVELYQEWINRLAKVDLLDQAIAAQDALVKNRLQGVERAIGGDRLAELLLMNQMPRQALTALDNSNEANLPAEVATRRGQRRAQANSELGQVRVALSELATDTSPQAARLRARIAWQAGDWPTATNAFLSILPAKPKDIGEKLNDEDSAILANLAIAATLANRPEILQALRQDWLAAMSETSQANIFNVLTNSKNPQQQRSVASQLADSTALQQFAKSLEIPKKPAETPGKPPAGAVSSADEKQSPATSPKP
jgi:hypothetical protein